MTIPAHLRGWKRWETNRRRQLRAANVLDLNGCKSVATHERRVRAAIGKIIGNPAAKALRLMVCDAGRDPDLWFGFVLLDPMKPETWRKLREIPGLFLPLERD